MIRKIVRYSFYPALSLGSLAIFFSYAREDSIQQISTVAFFIAISSMLMIHVFERGFPYRITDCP